MVERRCYWCRIDIVRTVLDWLEYLQGLSSVSIRIFFNPGKELKIFFYQQEKINK